MPIPRYQVIFNSLLGRIRDGEFPPGSKIPRESDLIVEYGVSRITVIRAIKELQQRRLLTRVKGHGTFVREPEEAAGETSVLPKMVSVIFPQGEQNGAHDLLMGIEQVCSDQGYLVTIHNTRNSGKRERVILESILAQRPSGVVLYPTGESEMNTDLISRFLIDAVPLVLVDRSLPYLEVPLVACDNKGGAQALVRLLVDQGRRRIAFFGHSLKHLSSEQERYSGYCQALIGSGIALDTELVRMVHPAATYSEGVLDEALGELQARGVDAIFAVNDLLAIALLRRLLAQGRRVPGDIALVGFDDIEVSSHLTPALTTLRQPFWDIGVRAAERLLSLSEGAPTNALRVPGLLVERQTTGPAQA